ncbi:MAG: sarcosine oxidase subunit gamma [Steroidobacteraceae bacterium]
MVDASGARQPQILASSPILRQLPAASRHVLRGGSQVMSAAADALSLPPSETPCRAVRGGSRAALWLGPDERLLIGPADGAGQTAGLLRQALAGMAHSLVEVSHALAAFAVSGSRAAQALNAGCPLDLDPASFPLEMCTRTVFAKAQIVLWRTDPEVFHVETARSFAPYVTKLLALVARES